MSFSESALTFGCEDEALVGVLTTPATPGPTAVLIIVGGPQYRVGSHRQFVTLARFLAREGYPVLRFDYRGMGDSTGAGHHFEQTSADIGAAVDALQHQLPHVQKVVLWGLCDGASAALLYCDERADTRIAGLCLLNPWVRTQTSLARTHVKHYYGRRLMQRSFWLKLLRGKVGTAALRGLSQNVAQAGQAAAPGGYQDRMASAWLRFKRDILLVLSGNDYTAKEFIEHARTSPAWSGALSQQNVVTRTVAGATHTFSEAASRAAMQASTLQWLNALR